MPLNREPVPPVEGPTSYLTYFIILKTGLNSLHSDFPKLFSNPNTFFIYDPYKGHFSNEKNKTFFPKP